MTLFWVPYKKFLVQIYLAEREALDFQCGQQNIRWAQVSLFSLAESSFFISNC